MYKDMVRVELRAIFSAEIKPWVPLDAQQSSNAVADAFAREHVFQTGNH